MVPLSDATDADEPEGWDFWRVKETGNYQDDYATGAEYAQLALGSVADAAEATHLKAGRHFEPSRILSRILFAIISKNALGPIEYGFLDRIGRAASVAYSANQHQFFFDAYADDVQ